MRIVSQAMGHGLAIEELKKKKKFNWATYTKWTNANQWKRRQKSTKGGHDNNCVGFRLEDGLEVLGEATLGYRELDSGMDELQDYKEYVDKLFKEAKLILQRKLKERDKILLMDVMAQKQAID